MPEIIYYEATQVRSVRISATNATDAAALAERVFNRDVLKEADRMNIQSQPKTKELSLKRVSL